MTAFEPSFLPEGWRVLGPDELTASGDKWFCEVRREFRPFKVPHNLDRPVKKLCFTDTVIRIKP